MPDIEDYIGEKITVNTITEDVLATDINPPVKRTSRSNSYQKKRTNPPKNNALKPRSQVKAKNLESHSKTAEKTKKPASIPENPQ